ncbi:MAG: hypothetical protein FWG84_00565 [Bacteroidales bacterium]|nr:hypothetical protein [Bacteroidales bacterium]
MLGKTKKYLCYGMAFVVMLSTAFVACKKDKKDDDNNNGIVYYNNDIEGITKVKSLLVDADCDKGILISGVVTSIYGTRPYSDTFYCDGFGVDATNVDEAFRELGTLSSAEYHRNNQMAILVFKSQGTFGGYGNYYIGNIEETISFYTKNEH